jgi:hypothetical protein
MGIFLFLFSLIMQRPNYCSCIPLGPIDDKQFNEYSLIVKGKVAKVTVHNFERTIYFTVDIYYKGGGNQTQIKIITPSQEGVCGIIPKAGENWLMFAYANGADYKTELCTRTKNMNPKAWN